MSRIWLSLIVATTALTGCDLSPDFTPPSFDLPETFKESPKADDAVDASLWEEIKPSEAIDRGEWWRIFDDEVLNQIQQDALMANTNLAIAAERVVQARQESYIALADLFPSIDAGFSPKREKFSSGSPNLAPGQVTKPQTSYRAQGILSYELDLFGRLTGAYRVAELNAEATDALYNSVLVSMQADVAQFYFSLRTLDAERQFQKRVLAAKEESLRVAKRLYDVGETSDLERSRAEADLALAKSEAATLDRRRAELENSMAVLLGKIPSSYHFEEFPLAEKKPPSIPAGIPANLLARRPDIAAAIRKMEANNRRIGMARAAMFPRIVLTAVGGYESQALSDAFEWSNRSWSIGPGMGNVVTQPVFEGGRIFFTTKQLFAEREESVAEYRGQVLNAFKEVEDSLAAIRLLAEEAVQQRAAAESSMRSATIARTRYEAGDLNQADALEYEALAMNTRRGAIRSHGARYAATISLIRALGGGWDFPKEAAIEQPAPIQSPATEEIPDAATETPTPL
ncbi:MAG: efflux transporter outer membrane subunit [Alphaproteobacteria bacterium]